MAVIGYVRGLVGQQEYDTSRDYPYITRHLRRVEVHLNLTMAEYTLLGGKRRGERRPVALLGPALRWHMSRGSRITQPSLTAVHAVPGNQYRLRDPHRIAERTLQQVNEVLARLSEDA